jgi:hypothetical protein
MIKRNNKIKILIIWGIFVGLFYIFVGITEQSNIAFLFIGLIYFFLSLGIYMLWNWARIITIISSLIFIGIYFILIFAAFNRAYQGFAGIACFVHSPLFLLSVYSLDVLLRKENKIMFLKEFREHNT